MLSVTKYNVTNILKQLMEFTLTQKIAALYPKVLITMLLASSTFEF